MGGRKRNKQYYVYPIVEQLIQIRKSKKLSLDKLSKKLGYNIKTIGDWERGKHQPILSSLINWAEILGVKLELSLDKIQFPTKSKLMGSK